MPRLIFALIVSLLSSAAAAKSIVVLGDSISAGYGIEVAEGWVALLQSKLTSLPEQWFIHNESISGDTSAGGLARLDQALQRHKPDLLLLELGANDGLRGLSPVAMKSNLTEIIRRSQKAGAKVLLLGMKIPPNYGKRYIDMFYNIYPELATELNVPLMPFILDSVALDSTLMQADGLHPNAKAQPKIADNVWSYV
ncbi:MAG: arylesterase, partial [Methylococcales bacterium]